MIRSPTLARILSATPCHECRGRGRIVLFSSVRECDQCNGRGRLFPHAAMSRSVDEFDLSWRARVTLDRLHLRTIADLARVAWDDVRRRQFADPLVLEEVDRLLNTLGIPNRN